MIFYHIISLVLGNNTAQPQLRLAVFTHVDLFVAACHNIHIDRHKYHTPAAISSCVSHTHKRDFSTIFSNFQTLLAAFFPHKKVHTDKPSDFFEKTLAIVQLEDVSSAAPRVRGLTPGAVSPLSASVLSSERQRNSTFSWPYRSRLVNKSFTKQHFQAPVAY